MHPYRFSFNEAHPGLGVKEKCVASVPCCLAGCSCRAAASFNHAFDVMIPWLLLAATAAFAFGPRLMTTGGHSRAIGKTVSMLSVLAVTIYGGYFNGGVGIILLAVFNLLGLQDLNAANGLKNLVSLLLTAIAVAIYAWGGAVAWPEALLMMVAATAGGYIGARAIRRLKADHVRYGVIAVGLIMTALFFAY